MFYWLITLIDITHRKFVYQIPQETNTFNQAVEKAENKCIIDNDVTGSQLNFHSAKCVFINHLFLD
jgi:hypothetical protein